MKPKDIENNLLLIKNMTNTDLNKQRKCLICNGTGEDPVFNDANDDSMPERKYKADRNKAKTTKCRACNGTGTITLKVKKMLLKDKKTVLTDCVIYDRYIDKNGALITKVKELPL